VLDGGDGDDTLSGSSGSDTLTGGPGNDALLGKASPDTIRGGDGNDTVTGGDGDDAGLHGDAGDDVFVWNPGDDTDTAEGDEGTDRLQLNGGNGAESFSVTPNGTRVRVDRLTPAPFAQDLGSVEKVVVQANGGDDTIAAANGLATLTQLTLDGGAGADNITGGDGNDVILGGDDGDTIAPGRGNDLALMGTGDDKATWNPGDGSDTLEGQSGNDTMAFNGSNVGEHIDLSANGGRLRLFRDVAAITMDTDDIERIDLAALGGADTITAGDLSGTDVTAVIADLASTPGGTTGDGQPDHVIATGTNGDDAITVSGSSGDVLVSGLHAGIGIRHAEPTDSLSIHTLAGADGVNSGGLAAGTIQLDTD